MAPTIRLFVLLLLLMFPSESAGQMSTVRQDAVCPALEVKGPKTADALHPIEYTVNIKKLPNGQVPQIKWQIEGGKILKGQGTNSIKVVPNARSVKAKIALLNYYNCVTFSATTRITGPLPNSGTFAIAASVSGITASCPNNPVACFESSDSQLQLTAGADVLDDDTAIYTWSVTAGRVLGEGRTVTWDLSGAPPGSHSAKVNVEDGQGNAGTADTTVSVNACGSCAVPDETLITGSVQGEDGEGLRGAEVVAIKTGSSKVAKVDRLDGRYLLKPLQTGTYRVTASMKDYKSDSQTIELKESGDQKEVNFQLRKVQKQKK